MKKVFLTLIALGTILSSCGDAGRDAETGDAKEVVDNTTENTIDFNKIEVPFISNSYSIFHFKTNLV